MELYVPGGGFGSSGCLGSVVEVLIVAALRVTRHSTHSRVVLYRHKNHKKNRMNSKTDDDLKK